MKIAILGGSFDPPHLGHILIARQVKELLPVDQVWLMPGYKHTFGKLLSPANHRLAMTKFLEEDEVKVSDFEIANKGSGDSIDTLHALAKKFPNDTFSWIIGSDQLKDFRKWPKWREIMTKFGLIIFPREIALLYLRELVNTSLQLTTVPKNVILMDSPSLILTNISSSAIRRRVRDGLSIDLLVPNGVEGYIMEHKIYQ